MFMGDSCTCIVSNSQVIGCEDRLQNDLYCVGWGAKLYPIQSKSCTCIISYTEGFTICTVSDFSQFRLSSSVITTCLLPQTRAPTGLTYCCECWSLSGSCTRNRCVTWSGVISSLSMAFRRRRDMLVRRARVLRVICTSHNTTAYNCHTTTDACGLLQLSTVQKCMQ